MYQVWDYDIFLFNCKETEVVFYEEQGFRVEKVSSER